MYSYIPSGLLLSVLLNMTEVGKYLYYYTQVLPSCNVMTVQLPY